MQKLTFAGLGLIHIFQSISSPALSAVGLSRGTIDVGAGGTVVKGSSGTVSAGSLVRAESVASVASLAGHFTLSCASLAVSGALYNMAAHLCLVSLITLYIYINITYLFVVSYHLLYILYCFRKYSLAQPLLLSSAYPVVHVVQVMVPAINVQALQLAGHSVSCNI